MRSKFSVCRPYYQNSGVNLEAGGADDSALCKVCSAAMLRGLSRVMLGLVLGVTLQIASAQEMPLRIGETVTALHFPVVFQSGQAIPRKGHPLLIEYWATWCGSCVASIPHLNELANEFEKQGVDFLMLTNQTSSEVIPFLQKHPMTGMVASDAGFSTNRLLQAPGLPFTLLVDADGRLGRNHSTAAHHARGS
jgi:thiol-disulfide isomerase/thioredoxin